MKGIFCNRTQYPNLAFLLLRVAVGFYMINAGYGKMFNPGKWEWLGSQLPLIQYAPMLKSFFGFMASFAEFFGGIFLVVGVFIQPAALLIMITMLVASHFHYLGDGNIYKPMSLAIGALCVFFANGDRFSLQNKHCNKD